MLFFTSGMFFDNNRIANKRHFRSTLDMNQTIISNWNSVITSSDEVYILGGVGEFGYLPSLNGKKMILMAPADMRFYNTYITGVTPVRDEEYDREMFEVYVNMNYNIERVSFSNRIICRLYSGRNVALTTGYSHGKDEDRFNVVGGIGDFQRMFPNGINSEIYINGMYPLSETDIESLIHKSKDRIIT